MFENFVKFSLIAAMFGLPYFNSLMIVFIYKEIYKLNLKENNKKEEINK